MATPAPHHEPNPRQARPTLFFIVLTLIVALLAAFLLLHPHPAGAPNPSSPASQH